jgi:hypothetical protein
MTLSFLLTSLIVVVSPGTGVLYTLAVALTQGARPSVAAAFGCTLGIVPQMLAAMLGLAAVLHTSALAFAALKWCGVVYLLYMSWQALRETGALSMDTAPAAAARSSRRVIGTAILINILHPKLSIAVDFLPRLPAAVRRRRRGPSAGADAGIERRLHGDDVCGVRRLWPVRGFRPRPRHLAAEGDGLAAPQLRSRLRRAGGQAGVRGAVAFTPPSLRANGSRECAPDDRLREAIHRAAKQVDCFVAIAPLRRRLAFVAGNDGGASPHPQNQKGGPKGPPSLPTCASWMPGRN